MKKLIVNLAPTGVVPDRSLTPHVPVTAEEIAADACGCSELGVSMVHLHARDPQGLPTYRKEAYARIIAAVRERRPDLVIVVSTSGRVHGDFEQRADVLGLEGDLKPDMATLTLGSFNFSRSGSVNSPDTIRRLAETMAERGIKPELEVFDLGMVNYARYLIGKGALTGPFYFNLLVGNIATAQANLLHIGALVSDLPAGSLWSLAGIGRCQTAVNAVGAAVADGIRVGIEDNVWYDEQRTVLATNRSLCERMVAVARLLGREPASPAEVRAMLGLPPGAGGP